jgi:hypothetical protein
MHLDSKNQDSVQETRATAVNTFVELADITITHGNNVTVETRLEGLYIRQSILFALIPNEIPATCTQCFESLAGNPG